MSIARPVFLAIFAALIALLPLPTLAEVQWREVEKGFFVGEYEIPAPGAVLRSKILLARFDPKLFAFQVVQASDVGAVRSDVRAMAKSVKAVAAINANFFDPEGNPLGLVIANAERKHRIQLGGKVLTGVFAVSRSVPQILHRNEFREGGISSAVQAGPRIIAGGRAIELDSTDIATRRSGIAITKTGDVILYATLLRFPGASLLDIQRMLLSPELHIQDALNFDGGGSSQSYISELPGSAEVFISGGDLIPVGLAVRRR